MEYKFDEKSTINQRIAVCRKLRDMTQADVAEKLDMKCSTYSQMERKGNISAQMILKLAAIFNVQPDEILYGKSDVFTPPPPSQEPTGGKLASPIEPPIPQGPAAITLTNREENIIKIIRNLPKEVRDEIISFIEIKYKENK